MPGLGLSLSKTFQDGLGKVKLENKGRPNQRLVEVVDRLEPRDLFNSHHLNPHS